MNPGPRLLEMPKPVVCLDQSAHGLEPGLLRKAKILAFPVPLLSQSLLDQERQQTNTLRELSDPSTIRKLKRELRGTRALIYRLLEDGAKVEFGPRRAGLQDIERDRPGAEPVKYKLLRVG